LSRDVKCVKKSEDNQMPVVHIYNPSYSEAENRRIAV
jgi:hypothetical protein